MTFDKLNVYSVLTADMVKPGSIGYVADSLAVLKGKVAQDDDTVVLTDVLPETVSNRFKYGEECYSIFYLVEEPKEKKLRPYKDTNEMIADYKKRFNYIDIIPTIWVMSKNRENTYNITGFNKDKVYICNVFEDLYGLLNSYTYLDGSPCGMEE